MNYYNEHDPKAAAWLRVLIAENLIAKGEVDERNIQDVRAVELAGYRQCHFFAGIGGWALALRLAGVPDDAEVDTGSCPCQPFSCAGKGEAQADERHLWPNWFDIIRERRPKLIFGEQVDKAIGFGWLDGISADLEAEGYAIGAAVLGAHSVGAPHKRQRLYWVANAQGHHRGPELKPGESTTDGRRGFAGNCVAGVLVQPDSAGRHTGKLAAAPAGHGEATRPASGDGLAVAQGDSKQPGLERFAGNGDDRNQPGRLAAQPDRPVATAGSISAWSDFDILPFRDGKFRRVEAGTFPLASRVPNRVGLLRGYGNAIVPQVAAEFIQASYEALNL